MREALLTNPIGGVSAVQIGGKQNFDEVVAVVSAPSLVC